MKIDSVPPSATFPSADTPVSPSDESRLSAVSLEDEPSLSPPGFPSSALEPVQNTRPAPFSRTTTRLVVLAGVVLLLFFLLQISGILDPFLWAIVAAYSFNPLVTSLSQRLHVPRALVIAVMYLVVLGAFGAILAAAIPALNDEVARFSRALPTISADLQARYFGTQSQPLSVLWFNIDVPQVARTVTDSLNAALNNLFGGMFKVFSATVTRVTQLFLFLIVTFYLLVDAPKFGSYFVRLVPQQHRDEVLDVARQMDRCLSQYIRAEGLLILIMGSASFIVLSVLGVQFAIILAPVVGLLEIFPIIGPFAAITLVTVVALFSPSNFGWSHTTLALIVALIFFIMRQIEDYAVIPHIVGHAVRLHPALILFAVAVGASLGGALGLFVAVPVTGALKVLGGYLYQKLDLG